MNQKHCCVSDVLWAKVGTAGNWTDGHNAMAHWCL